MMQAQETRHIDSGRYGANYVRGNPTQYRFEINEIEDNNQDYTFDILAVFRHVPSNKMWYGRDSGCSCPSPFEDYYIDLSNLKSDLEPLNKETLAEFERAVNAYDTVHIEERHKLIEDVRALLEIR